MRHWLGVVAVGAVVVGTGCGGEVAAGGEAVAMPTPAPALGPATLPGPTFAEVYEQVLSRRGCVSSYCHYLIAGPSALGPVQNTYAHLVGASADQGCDGMSLVVPGDPGQSLLYLKVSTDTPPCGKRMPAVGPRSTRGRWT
jgi:hypothetical protein